MPRSASPSIPAALGIAAIVLAGCGGAGGSVAPASPPVATPTTAPAAPPTQAPATASPTEAVATTTDICPVAEASGGEPIAAGTYRFAGPTVAFTLTLPEGYGAACNGSNLALFAADGSIALIAGVARVGTADGVADVDATIDAVETAVTTAAASVDGPRLATIGDVEGTSLLVTTGDAGMAVKGPDGRGWAWAKDEAPTALITMVEGAPGTIVMAIRSWTGMGSSAEPLGEDVLNSIVFE